MYDPPTETLPHLMHHKCDTDPHQCQQLMSPMLPSKYVRPTHRNLTPFNAPQVWHWSPPMSTINVTNTLGCHLKVNGWEICFFNKFSDLQLCCCWGMRVLALPMYKKTLKRLPFTHFSSDFRFFFTKIFVWFSPFQRYLILCSSVIARWDRVVLRISRIIHPPCWHLFRCVFRSHLSYTNGRRSCDIWIPLDFSRGTRWWHSFRRSFRF